MASRQAASKKFQRVCEICSRSTRNERLLGPLIHTKTISAHYNCVLFCPVTVDATSRDDGGICGVTARFIRTEGCRAKKLKCNYCKTNGAHAGCCFDIGTDSVLKFCPKQYHVDCGSDAGASFNVSKGRGAVSLCFDHRDPIERADEKAREPSNDSISIGDEYDVGEGTIGSIELNEVTNETVQPEYLEEGYHQAETSCSIDLIEVEDTLDPLTDDTAQPEYLEEEFQVEFQDVKEESFNMEPIRASLDNSDCVVTAAYFLEVQTDADEETETEIEK